MAGKCRLTPEEEAELGRMLDAPFKEYAVDFLKIQDIGDDTTGDDLIPFELNETQRIYDAVVSDLERRGLLIRLAVLKARRQGITTATSGRFYKKTSTANNKHAVHLAHEPEATDTIFKMVKRFHSNFPSSLRPHTKYDNKDLLEFNVTDKEARSGKVGLDSSIRVATASKVNFGSSQQIELLHISEMAKVEPHIAGKLLDSLLPCVPDTLGTEIIFESTAYGVGGEFYDRFKGARYRYVVYLKDNGTAAVRFTISRDADPDNAYASLFIPWFVFKKYEIHPKDYGKHGVDPDIPFVMSEDEKKLLAAHMAHIPPTLAEAKLRWYRYCLASKCRGSKDTRAQEFPSTEKEAFVFSGNAAFDNGKIDELLEEVKPPKARYSLIPQLNQFYADDDGAFLVWEEPKRGHWYIVSGDAAEGKTTSDFNSVDVVDAITGDQVAHWHGRIAPDEFAYILSAIGHRYSDAWVVPERNNHGGTTITHLVKLIQYPRVYISGKKIDGGQGSVDYGFWTSKESKLKAINNLDMEVRESESGINHKDTLKEMLTYVKHPDGSYGGIKSKSIFDDRVMSIVIAKWVRRFGNLEPATPPESYDTVYNAQHSGMAVDGTSAPKPGAYD